MLTILLLTVGATMVLVLVLLVVVVIGMRQESSADELRRQAPSIMAALVRRLLGVYVRRPILPADSTDLQEEWSPDMPSATTRSRPSGGRR
jgi:hypothetical protein